VRREIIRQIATQPQTQNQLADKLELRSSTISHHLKVLREAGFIKIEHSEVGTHGILEKYYEPTSNLFIEDFERTPPELQKYFLQFHIERLRGMLSVSQLIGKTQTIEVTSSQLQELAQEIARHMAIVGERYKKTGAEMNRETLLITIYSEALKEVMTTSKWKDFFDLFYDVPQAASIVA